MENTHTSKHVKKLIHHFRLELVAPVCVPGSDRWNAKAHLDEDISKVFPYLNAELKNADYDHHAKVLIWKDHGKNYAFRPYEMSSALLRIEKKGIVS